MKWLTIIAALGLISPVSEGIAHGAAPAALGFFGPAESDSLQPAFIRMNIGLARREGPSDFRYLCPSLWGGSTQPFAAASADSQSVIVVAGGKVYASYDGGCSFEMETFSEEYGTARDVRWSEGRAYVLVSGESTGALYSAGEEEWRQEMVFGGGGSSKDVSPDSFRVESHNGEVWVGVAGARPTIEVWFGVVSTEGSGPGSWTQLPPAPEISGAQAISVRAVEDEGALWLVSTHTDGKRVWRVAPTASQGGATGSSWSSLPGFFETVLGPVRDSGSWVAVLDGRLERVSVAEQGGQLLTTEGIEVDWTCLQELEGERSVCTLPQLYSIAGELLISDPDASLEPSFDLSMLRAPETDCLSPGKADECFGEWVHFGGEAGLLAKDSGLSSALGCEVASGVHFREREAVLLFLVFGLFMLRIRQRSSPAVS